LNKGVAILSFFICLLLISGGLIWWQSEQTPEKKLEEYLERLKSLGYWVEERPLKQWSGVWETRKHFDDFLFDLRNCEWRVDVYIDRERGMLYFFQPVNIKRSNSGYSYQSRLIVFYYK